MEPIISIRNCWKRYESREVLKGISFDIYPGQVIGYIGPNGAGKSTTVKILAGLISDYEGEVFIMGRNCKEEMLALKSHIGYVPELAEIYDMLSPEEYLTFIGALYKLDREIALERSQKMLAAFGMQENFKQRMDSFSKGMKQKVLIISALLHNPDIIILDEPLSGLDANSVIILKELIAQLAKEGKTIFYCSHMMDVVEKVSDRILLIDNGTVIADGTFEMLQAGEGNASLEKIFSNLTAPSDLAGAAGQIMRAMK